MSFFLAGEEHNGSLFALPESLHYWAKRWIRYQYVGLRGGSGVEEFTAKLQMLLSALSYQLNSQRL